MHEQLARTAFQVIGLSGYLGLIYIYITIIYHYHYYHCYYI